VGGALREEATVLTDGFNHVAVITGDADRLLEFYAGVFGARKRNETAEGPPGADERVRLMIVDIGPHSELNVFEMPDNPEATRQTPMFGRGRLDHLAIQAKDLEAFEEIRRRLIARGAADEFVTDFGHVLSLFFRDPDGLECEVCVTNPDARPGVFHPPGTPAARYVA
jgi:catechol 2,3-dioxygenase-like lactoylglutathione lyase family enzyme